MFDKIKEKWKRASLADQIMAIATCVIACTTIIYTVFSIIQTNISQNIFNTEYVGSNRPLIPFQIGHPIRNKSAGYSGTNQATRLRS